MAVREDPRLICLHPDGDLSGSLLKDGGSSALIPRIHPIMRITRVATRVDPLPTWILPRWLQNSSRCYFSIMSGDESSPILTMWSQPIAGPTTMAPQERQQSTLDQHYDTASKLEVFPIQVNIRRCYWGTNPIREPYSKSFQTLQNQDSALNRHNKSNLKQGKI